MNSYHTPVLMEEVLEGLAVETGKLYIDATLGGGGHTLELVKRGGIVLGIDADSDAIEHATTRLEAEGKEQDWKGSWTLVQGNFRDIGTIARTHGFAEVSGILMDLGVSSFQLDTAEKGFSYRFLEGPLDMRLDRSQGETASEYIKSASEEDLYEIFTKYGEEERSRAIVHALIRSRQVKKITTVGQLLQCIDKAIGSTSDKYAVYSRIFQALRIYVNDEFGALREALSTANELLVSGGRLAIISFHSLEDRIVKQSMRDGSWKSISKKPILADPREVTINKRARSAKLRIVEKI